MSHSPETHRNLIARIPGATGRELPEWFKALDDGPSFLRTEDRVRWLRSEHGLAFSHASAIVHEQILQKAQRSFR